MIRRREQIQQIIVFVHQAPGAVPHTRAGRIISPIQPAVKAKLTGIGDPGRQGARRRINVGIDVTERAVLSHEDWLCIVADHTEVFRVILYTRAARVAVEIEEIQVGFLEQGGRLHVPIGRGNLRDEESHRDQRGWIAQQDFLPHLGNVIHNSIADHLSLLIRVAHVVRAGRRLDKTAGQRERRLVAEHPLLVEELPSQNGVEGRAPLDEASQQVTPVAAGRGDGVGS